jgi:hypothetical protein
VRHQGKSEFRCYPETVLLFGDAKDPLGNVLAAVKNL